MRGSSRPASTRARSEASVRRALLRRWSSLVECAWASPKSLKPKRGKDGDEPPASSGRNEEVDFRGEKRSNQTHASTTDPDARLYRKGSAHGSQAQLHRSRPDGKPQRPLRRGTADRDRVSGHAERLAALDMIEPYADRATSITLGGDKGFDAADFIMELGEINVTPHVAQNTTCRSAIDRRTTRHPGYDISQRAAENGSKRAFGWMKPIGGMRKPKYRSREKGRLVIRSCSRRLQPDPPAKAHGPTGMSATRTPTLNPYCPSRSLNEQQRKSATSSTDC